MELLANSRGHEVFVRCPTSPPSYEAACDCGFRSARYYSEADARDAGSAHSEQAPEIKAPKRRSAKKKTTRKK